MFGHENIQIGDVVKAVDECVMEDSNEASLTVGKLYGVVDVEDGQFVIIDDCDDRHHFDIEEDVYFVDNK